MDVQICQKKASDSFAKQFLMATFCAAVIFVTLTFTIISAFYPIDAAVKGLSPTEVGLVFAIFQGGVIIFGPIINYVSIKLGLRFVYLWSLFVCMVATMLFGFTKYAVSTADFLLLSMAVRILQGASYFGVQSSAITMATELYPEDVSKAVSLIEVANGIGFSAGPPIGGGLYEIGGYLMPFICVPVVCLLILLWSLIFTRWRPHHKETIGPSQEYSSPWKILSIAKIHIGLINLAMYTITYVFLDVALSPFMVEKFGMKEYEVGLVFMGECLVYGICGPFVGYFVDKTKVTTAVMLMGCIVNTLAYFFIGPAVGYGIKRSLVAFIVWIHVIGLSSAMTFVPTMQYFVDAVVKNGYGIDMKIKTLLSTLLTIGGGFGGLVGPILGGALVENYGFEFACLVLAIMNGAMAVIHLFDFITTSLPKNRKKNMLLNLNMQKPSYGLVSKNDQT